MARSATPNGCQAPDPKTPPSGIQWLRRRPGESSLNPSGTVARRWTVIASGLLILALALVVIYTGPNAFHSPIALVVVAAIGLAALLLQLRFRQDLPHVRTPLRLNILGVLCALSALAADFLKMRRLVLEAASFSAVVFFSISGSLILHALRKPRKTAE